MRGDDRQQAAMWSYISPEQRVPADHPLRPLRTMADGDGRAVGGVREAVFAGGRPSIAPEKLLRALLLQTVKYQELIPMLLNELQREHQEVATFRQELAQLRALVGSRQEARTAE